MSDDEDMEEIAVGTQGSEMMFSSQVPDMSQKIPEPRQSEQQKLDRLGGAERDTVIRNMTRTCLFAGLCGQSIDRTALKTEHRVTTAALQHVNHRLRGLFDFEMQSPPAYLKHLTASKLKHMYLINICEDTGEHSKALHRGHGAAERGLLMTILALCYCHGWWIRADDLYSHLHALDENIPKEPAVAKSQTVHGVWNVDSLLKQFVKKDYLSTRKDETNPNDMNPMTEYGLGPRAALEIGRPQVVHFCAEVLGQQPDPTMLAEFTQDTAAA